MQYAKAADKTAGEYYNNAVLDTQGIEEATINFYMPGVTEGANIAAVQYINGAWVDVNVKEVRADHVILDLKSNGVVAFLEK